MKRQIIPISLKGDFFLLNNLLIRPLDLEQGASVSQSEARIRIMEALGPIRSL